MNWNLKTTQAKVVAFIEAKITESGDFDNPLNLAELGFPAITLDFDKLRALAARALTVELQSKEKKIIEKAAIALYERQQKSN